MASITAYPINPKHKLLAPTRTPKPRVVVRNASVPKPTSAQITAASQVIARSGLVQMMEPLMPHARREEKGEHPGGRKPDISIKAVLTAFLMLAIMERPIFVRDVWRMLEFGLDSASRKHLGLGPKFVVTEKMVSNSFGLIAAALNPSAHSESNAVLFVEEKMKELLGMGEEEELDQLEHALLINEILTDNETRLDEFVRKGLAATHPKNSGHEGDYALDGTYISSWEASHRSRRATTYKDKYGVKQPKAPRSHEMSDPDATWWTKGDNKADSGLGYLVTAVVWMEKDCGVNNRGADIPYLIDHLAVKTGAVRGAGEGARVVETMIAHHEKEDELAGKEDRVRGDITADREYSRAIDWQLRMHNVGLTPHFMLTQNQLRYKKTLASGVVIVDGIPYSPGMPESLRKSIEPSMFSTKDDRAYIAAHNLQRAPFRIRVDGGARQANGSLKFYCAASVLAKGAISCANKPSSQSGRLNRIQIGNALPVIVNSPKPAICTQSSVTVPFDEVPYWQPYIPGTPEHQWSVNRRNLVESAFSKIKDEAKQSVRRGTFRVMGRAKVSLVVLFNSMAANLVEVERWRLRQAGVYSLDAAREIKTRMPRRHTRSRIIASNSRTKVAREIAAIAALAERGERVDLVTGEILLIGDPPKP